MAYHFTKSSLQNIDVPGFPSFSTKLTLSAWIFVDATPTSSQNLAVFSRGTTAGGDQRNYSFDYRNSSGTVETQNAWTTSTGNYTGYAKTITLSTSTWIHICDTVDWSTNPDTVQLYINGTAQNPSLNVGTNNTTPQTSGSTTRIASLYDGNDAFNGSLAELAVWFDVLNASEVASLALGFSPWAVHSANLKLYVPLRRQLQDIIGARILANNNGATVVDHTRVFMI